MIKSIMHSAGRTRDKSCFDFNPLPGERGDRPPSGGYRARSRVVAACNLRQIRWARISWISWIVILSFVPLCGLRAEVLVGVKKGLSLSHQYGFDSVAVQEEPVAGFSGGAYLAWAVTDLLVLQPEVLFSQRGRYGRADDGDSERINLAYLDFPLLLKWRFINTQVKSSVYTGGFFSIALGGSVRWKFDSHEEGQVIRYSLKEELNPFDAGLLAGLDFGIYTGAYLIYLDIRYTLGLLPAIIPERARNGSFSFQIGYGFRL